MKKLARGFGLKYLIVVDAGDVILVMDKNKDQEIKYLLNDIINEGSMEILAKLNYL